MNICMQQFSLFTKDLNIKIIIYNIQLNNMIVTNIKWKFIEYFFWKYNKIEIIWNNLFKYTKYFL